tara:strand:- start:3771 stop:4166 length:396 start_codon:yes stop_codon:yes gene_type:complete
MRVTVNYNIDFKEVENLLNGMLDECENKMKKVNGLLATVSYAFNKGNLIFMNEAMDELRQTMAQVDLDLAEVSEMAASYLQAKSSLEEPAEKPPEEDPTPAQEDVEPPIQEEAEEVIDLESPIIDEDLDNE